MSNYATVANVKDYKIAGMTVDLTSYSDAEIQERLNAAEEKIEAYCRTWFYEKTVTEFLDGVDGTTLFFFPKILAPVKTITSLQLVDIDKTTIIYNFVENVDYALYPHYAKMHTEVARTRLLMGSTWGRGHLSHKIVGVFGKVPTPYDIKKAALLLTLEDLMPESTRMAHSDVKQAAWPDFSVTFHGGSKDEYSTGFNEVDRLLNPYVNVVDMFRVVPDSN
jgi:hypothetical protein